MWESWQQLARETRAFSIGPKPDQEEMESVGRTWSGDQGRSFLSARQIVELFTTNLRVSPRFKTLAREAGVIHVMSRLSGKSVRETKDSGAAKKPLTPDQQAALAEQAESLTIAEWNNMTNYTYGCLRSCVRDYRPENPAVIALLLEPIGQHNPLVRCVLSNMHAWVVWVYGHDALGILQLNPLLKSFLERSRNLNFLPLIHAPAHTGGEWCAYNQLREMLKQQGHEV